MAEVPSGASPNPGAPTADPLVAALPKVPLIPDYELLRRIGRGAYGDVWLARTVLGEYRAVKIVYRSRFEHERPYEREFEGIRNFEPVSRLHESQLDVLHVGCNAEEGFFYYVMELADPAVPNPPVGATHPRPAPADFESYTPRTLRSDLHQRNRLPLDECLEIGVTLTKALEYLHSHGLIHRDVKPANIVFVNGIPKLADIGLVATMNSTMSYVGTPGYLPPEGPGTLQGDLYSLGMVLYEMSTGRDRHDFPKLPANLAEFANPAGLLELNAVILKACQRDPRQRFQSAQAMHAELQLLQRGHSIRRARTAQKGFAVAKGAAFSLLGIGLVLWALFFLKDSKRARLPNSEAVRQYELGRWHRTQLTPEAHQKAVEYLNQAIQRDPKFVLPYVELFEVYIWGFSGIVSNRLEQVTRTRDIANTILTLDPKRAEGYAALSYSKYLEMDWRGAEADMRHAIQLNPDYATAHSLYGYYLSLQGRIEEAQREVRLAEALEPASRTTVLVAGYPLMAARRFDDAIAQYQRVVNLDRNFPQAHNFLGRCYEAQSNYVAAIEEFKTTDLLSGEDPTETVETYSALRRAYETTGERGYWQKNLESLQADSTGPKDQFDAQRAASCYAKLGQKDKALEVLEEHFDEMTVWNALKFQPLFDSLHREPRFRALLKRAGFEN